MRATCMEGLSTGRAGALVLSWCEKARGPVVELLLDMPSSRAASLVDRPSSCALARRRSHQMPAAAHTSPEQ